MLLTVITTTVYMVVLKSLLHMIQLWFLFLLMDRFTCTCYNEKLVNSDNKNDTYIWSFWLLIYFNWSNNRILNSRELFIILPPNFNYSVIFSTSVRVDKRLRNHTHENIIISVASRSQATTCRYTMHFDKCRGVKVQLC